MKRRKQCRSRVPDTYFAKLTSEWPQPSPAHLATMHTPLPRLLAPFPLRRPQLGHRPPGFFGCSLGGSARSSFHDGAVDLDDLLLRRLHRDPARSLHSTSHSSHALHFPLDPPTPLHPLHSTHSTPPTPLHHSTQHASLLTQFSTRKKNMLLWFPIDPQNLIGSRAFS